MTTFRYQALTAKGDLVSGSIDASSVTEVARRIEYLGLVPIDMRQGLATEASGQFTWHGLMVGKPKPADVTLFTRDLALVLSAGIRLEDALDLLGTDESFGRLRPVIASVRSAVLAGETFGAALARHPALFPGIYVSLVRVGEASGTLTVVLQALADERARTAALTRKVTEALSYPAFVLGAAALVLSFFIGFVLPQFGSVLRDFGAKVDPIVSTLLGVSDVVRANAALLGLGAVLAVLAFWLVLRQPGARRAIGDAAVRLPVLREFTASYRAALFCRTLGVLLGGGIALSTALRMLAETMAAAGSSALWTRIAERVRQGGKLADAIAEMRGLPPVAIRMIRLGEETGQLAPLAVKTAELFETKLERGLDKFVSIIGPAAILTISVVVGGLIVSIMTSLLSITQLVN